ncbi:MAG TPA: hypothetical protein VLC95_08145 [Anaerolineae bacterium]|nr:hypothetical protein [Anaerolineae bacterium]
MKDTWKWMGMALVLLLVAACVPGQAPATAEPATEVELPFSFRDGFEDGLGAWELGADVPEDPNNPGRPVAWDIEASGDQAVNGRRSVRLELDGSQDDGIIWLARSFKVPANTDLNAHLSFWLWSPSESFNTLARVAAYVGSEAPSVEQDFDTAQPADQAEGWRLYEYDLAFNSGAGGQAWIAAGISVVWETEVVYFIDDVELSLAEGPAGPGGGERPPAALLLVDGARQESGIGTYCWTTPGAFGQGVGVCADAIGIITPVEALPVPESFTARFQLPIEAPAGIVLNVIPVTGEDEIVTSPLEERDWRAWTPGAGEQVAPPLQVETEVEMTLDPGLYVLSMFARWEEFGDVNYGWLVQVGDGEPADEEPTQEALEEGEAVAGLVVEEYAIVADAEDKPTHLEYMQRIDPQILAQREAWRGVAPEQRAARANEVLAPFGYRLEPRFDAEWGQTFFDLYKPGQEDPLLTGLMNVRQPSVSAGGDKFVMAVENAPNSGHPYLLVTEEWVDNWQADTSAFLPPVYAGDEMVAVEVTPAVDLTYVVVRGGEAVYSGGATMTVDMPVRSLSGWGEHWALEVDDQVIVDGVDLGAREGYDAVFGFHVVGGEPFYFYRQDDTVYMSYAGETLPETYDQVVHDECCEPSMFNAQGNERMVWFHALRDGVWYYVEAGLFDQAPPAAPDAGTTDPLAGERYVAPEGWSIAIPAGWDVVDTELGFIQEPVTGKTITFESEAVTEEELQRWIEAEVARKLAATEAANSLVDPVAVDVLDGVTVLRYAILSRMEAQETLLRTTVFYDGARRYAFYAAIPPVTEEEYQGVLASFMAAPRP